MSSDKPDKNPDARPDPPAKTPEARIVPSGPDGNAARRQTDAATTVNQPLHGALSGLGDRARDVKDHVGNGLSAAGGKAREVAYGVADQARGRAGHVADGAHRATDAAKGAVRRGAAGAGDAAQAAGHNVRRAAQGAADGAANLPVKKYVAEATMAGVLITSGITGMVANRLEAREVTTNDTPAAATVRAATRPSATDVAWEASAEQVGHGLEAGAELVMDKERDDAQGTPARTPDDAVVAGPPDRDDDAR